MKLLHLADLHLGKKLRDYDLSEVQKDVLSQALRLVDEGNIDAVLLSGDIYDTGMPSGDTTKILDSFLTELWKRKKPVFLISGNHDSAEKLHFASSILREDGVHIVTDVKDSLAPIPFKDINFYLLPYVRYQDVNAAFDTDFKDLSTAVQYVISKMNLDTSKTNVLLAHQNVLPDSGILYGSGSETQPVLMENHQVGGVDSLPCSMFSSFDYVALGHIHKRLAFHNCLYPGSLLKYHKDEANDEKVFNVLEISNKHFKIETKKIHYLHDVVLLKGSFEELVNQKDHKEDYTFFQLSDKTYVPEAMAKLKINYPYAVSIEYPTLVSLSTQVEFSKVEEVSKEDLFAAFYHKVTGNEMSQEEKDYIEEQIQIAFSSQAKEE